jgi:polyisoprenoid-binding protein YceI
MKMRYLALLSVLAAAILLAPLSLAQVPVFTITPVQSTIKFNVKASVPLEGHFDKWDASLTFTSTDVATGVLDIKIQAATVDTGSGMKNGKLKGKDFFDVEENPLITFKSTKVIQTGPVTFDVPGTFTIRGVSKPETLTLTLSGKGTGSGEIKGTMAFDRKDYGMNSGIPFIKIADRVEVDIDLTGKRVSGPPLTFKQ